MKYIALFVLCLYGLSFNISSQVLETEESKPLMPGQFELGAGLEIQTSSEGQEYALPLSIEYGISKSLTLLVEPVPYTSIRPKTAAGISGLGDLELTLFYQLVKEKLITPSVSISGEVKIPTAGNKLIGTGKTDFTPYLILSKTVGKFFTSINLSYTFVGKPDGIDASNLFNYAIGTIFRPYKKFILFGEIFGNTSALEGNEQPENTAIPNTTELIGGETVIAGGFGYYMKDNLLLSFGVNYDNNKAVMLRPGIQWKLGK